jgi:CxxC motif-containing protein (DUF1111 family)
VSLVCHHAGFTTVSPSILGQAARDAFEALPEADQAALLAFLESI